MNFFGKSAPIDSKEQVKRWTSTVCKEIYKLDRLIRDIQRKEKKVKCSITNAAKKGNKDVCIILAKEILRSRKTINKLVTSKTHLNSILLQMKNQLSILRMAGLLQKSTELMKTMQNLMTVPEVAVTMRQLSKEMMKAGIMEKMLGDTLEKVMDDPEDMEEAAQFEIDNVLWEITAGVLGQAPMAVTETPGGTVVHKTKTIEKNGDLEELNKRLQALKNLVT